MALAYNRVLSQVVTSQTINSAASYTSAEQDLGDDTLGMQAWLYLKVAGFAAAPTGTMDVTVAPIHTASGTAYDDFGVTWKFTVAADQEYDFAIPLGQLPRYFKVTVTNSTNQNTDASAVDAWIEYVAVTA